MIVLTGADLFTSNVMFMTTAFLHRRVHIIDVLTSWFVSFFGNLAGTLFFMAIITGYGGVFQEAPGYTTAAINLAVQKAQQPQWHQVQTL
jgi:formate/nitrite transporter FocA (FNT family)